MTEIPPAVRNQVAGALSVLHEIALRLKENRALDVRFGSGGRYESEAYANRAGDVARARAVLAKFETAAAARSIAPGPVYAAFGGVPDLTLSPAAQSYADQQKGRETK